MRDHALPPRPYQTCVRDDNGKAAEDLGYLYAFVVADVLLERRGVDGAGLLIATHIPSHPLPVGGSPDFTGVGREMGRWAQL